MGVEWKAKKYWSRRSGASWALGMAGALFCFLCWSSSVSADTPWFSPFDAKNQVGKTVWICGAVGSARQARSVSGEPTYINLGPGYPDQVFTVVIWGSDRHKFEYRPENLDGGLCVRGRVGMYAGTPQIVVREPSQIRRSR